MFMSHTSREKHSETELSRTFLYNFIAEYQRLNLSTPSRATAASVTGIVQRQKNDGNVTWKILMEKSHISSHCCGGVGCWAFCVWEKENRDGNAKYLRWQRRQCGRLIKTHVCQECLYVLNLGKQKWQHVCVMCS